MKEFLKILLIFTIFMEFPVMEIKSQWQSSTGLDGGQISSMACIDTTLFANSINHGLFSKSINKGNWELIQYSNLLTGGKITQAGNCIIYYGGNNNYPLRTFDKGESWEEMTNVPSAYNTDVYSINTVTLWYYLNYRSFDYGNTFEPIIYPEQNYEYREIIVGESILYTNDYTDSYIIEKIHTSIDYGITWDSIPVNGLNNQFGYIIKSIKYLDDNYWASLKSTNTGYSNWLLFAYDKNEETWHNVSEGISNHMNFYAFGCCNNNVLCSFSNQPVYKFNKQDSIWIPFGDSTKNVTKFFKNDSLLYCSTVQGPCSLDTNGHFTAINQGLNFRTVSSICKDENRIYTTANNELFVSYDNAQSFTQINNAYGNQIYSEDSVLYLKSIYDFKISYDMGETWIHYNDGLFNYYDSYLNEFAVGNDFIFMGNRRGFFRSPKSDINWMLIENDILNVDKSVNYVETIKNTVLLLLTPSLYVPNKFLLLSTDYGLNFDTIDGYAHIGKTGTTKETYYIIRDTLFLSDDLAQTWDNFELDQNIFSSCAQSGDTMIIGGYKSGFYPTIKMKYDTINSWQSWIDIYDNMPTKTWSNHKGIQVTTISNNRIIVGNDGYGLWYRDDIITSTYGNNENTNILTTKVFPNPLSTETTFSFYISEKSNVTVIITDLIGNQIYSHNDYFETGNHSIIWQTNSCKSGVYCYSIKKNNDIITGKIVVIK